MIVVVSVIIIGFVVYFVLLMYSLGFSCGGWSKECGFCFVGIIQAPLNIIDWAYNKIKKKE